jgi:hypothetical protein
MSESITLNQITDPVVESVKSLQALLDTLQEEDSELQEEIRDTIDRLNAKAEQEETPPTTTEEDTTPEEDTESDEDNNAARCAASSDFSDGDVVATLALGFIAGAAVIGGGVLLHKLLTD